MRRRFSRLLPASAPYGKRKFRPSSWSLHGPRVLPDNISRDQVIELLQAMGFAGGIGAHRVGLKGGTNGKFHVEAAEMV